MWARKRIDITVSDLFFGIRRCLTHSKRPESLAILAEHFGSDLEPGLVCLSVRSGFDLALASYNWPRNSEIIFSGYNIADMPRIAREHGLQVVPVDIDSNTLAPDPAQLVAAITPRTRAILVAHLLGGRVDMNAISQIASEYGLVLIEDCAQAYVGNHFRGTPAAEISMFSFGPIKTNTALGGAVLFCPFAKAVETPCRLYKGNGRCNPRPSLPNEFASTAP